MSNHHSCVPWVASLALLSASACHPNQPPSAPTLGAHPIIDRGDTGRLDISGDPVLERKRLACAVLASNPELAAWRESWRAASARSQQPSALGATAVSYSFAPASIGSRAVRFGQVIQIEQSFKLGQTKLERQVAHAQADAIGHDVAANAQSLVLVTTTLLDEYYALTRALETNAEHHELVAALLDIATVRYSTGQAPQQDPLAADLEVAHIEHERAILASQRDVVVAQINGLLHRAPELTLPPPPDRLAADATDERGDSWSRPEVRAAIANEDAAERNTTLAQRRFTPAVSVMGTYNSMWRDVRHQFMVGAGISIPLQVRSLRAGVAEARAERSAARRRREAIDDAVAVAQATARLELKQAHHVAALHHARLVPTARARVEAARVGYETGANDFSAVIEAERELRTLALDYHRALAAVADKRAELEFALGRPLDCAQPGGPR